MPATLQSWLGLATRWYERHGSRLPGAISVLLVVLIAWMLSQLVWALVPTPDAARWQPAPVQSTRTATTARGPSLETLMAANLFGSYQAVPSSEALGSAPDTNLNLLLIGILAGSNEADSRALISQQGVDEAPYAIGADIVSGVTLHAIFPDRVILARNGTFETLRLDKDSPSRADNNPVLSGNSSGSDIDPMAPTGAMLGQIRDRILQDPGKASEYIRVQPSNQNGTLKGYRLYPGRSAEAFSHLGLRPGDLVTAVNGIQLDDGQKALQTLNELKQAGSVTLTVERGGQVQTLSVSLN